MHADFEALVAKGRLDEALAEVRPRLAAARAAHDDAETARALVDEAEAFWRRGDRDEAVVAIDEGISLARGAFGARDPRVAEAFDLGARVAADADMPHSAEARFRAARDILEAAGVRGVGLARVLHHHGLFRRDEGDLDGAVRAHVAALDALAGDASPEAAATEALCLTALGEVALDEGRWSDARALGDRALERWVDAGVARRSEVADALAVTGSAALREGDHEPATRLLAMACEVYQRSGTAPGARRARAEAARGEALAAVGRVDEAKAAITAAFEMFREGSSERMVLEERLLELSRGAS